MFPAKIDSRLALEVSPPAEILAGEIIKRTGFVARMGAIVIVASLPFLALWFLLRFIWKDVLAIGRGIRFFHRAVSEEMSRPS